MSFSREKRAPIRRQRRPRPPHPLPNNPLSIETTTGSYFEFLVRNIILNLGSSYPRRATSNHITDLEQMVYYYHLQMMHVDLQWIRNWQQQNRNGFPSLFQLPSRAVRIFYDNEVRYVFGDGLQRTLQSHRLICDECDRLFSEKVNLVHNHGLNGFFRNSQPLFERRSTTIPSNDIRLEEEQRRLNQGAYLRLTTRTTPSKFFKTTTHQEREFIRNQSSQGNVFYQSGPVFYHQTTSTTEDPLQRQMQSFLHSIKCELR